MYLKSPTTSPPTFRNLNPNTQNPHLHPQIYKTHPQTPTTPKITTKLPSLPKPTLTAAPLTVTGVALVVVGPPVPVPVPVPALVDPRLEITEIGPPGVILAGIEVGRGVV